MCSVQSARKPVQNPLNISDYNQQINSITSPLLAWRRLHWQEKYIWKQKKGKKNNYFHVVMKISKFSD